MQTRRTPLILLMGGVVLVLSAFQVQRDIPAGVRVPIPLFIAIGVLMALIAVAALWHEANTFHLESVLQRPARWFDISIWQVTLLVCAIPFSILVHYAAGEGPLMPSPVIGWGAWILSILLIGFGAWRYDRPGIIPARRTLWIAAGLSVLAFMVRGFAPESYPLVFSGDEASGGFAGLHILDGKFNNPFTMGWFSFPGLYFFIPAASIALFGQTLAALRIPSILAGSLTVGAAYLTSRTLHGKRVALLAAILLAGFQLHIHFSRMGLSNVWDGLFFVALAGTLTYAWEHEHRNAFVLAGFGLGLSQYFYATSRILPLLIVLWLALSGLMDRRRFRRLLPDILLMTAAALVVVLPLAWFYFHYPAEFAAPFVRVNAFGESVQTALQNAPLELRRQVPGKLWLGLLSFTFLPSFNMWFPSEVPFISLPLSIFFLAGLVYLLLPGRGSANLFLGLWIALFVLIGGFGDIVPSPQRYVAVVPACLMVTAFGLNRLVAFFENRWPRILPVSTRLVLLTCILLSLKDAVSYYTDFTPRSRAYYVTEAHGLIAQQLGRYLQTRPRDAQVIFFGYPDMGYHSIPSLQYLAPHIEGMDVLGTWEDEGAPRPDSQHLVFVFLPQHEDQIDLVREAYPGGQVYGEGTYWGRILYYYYVYDE